MDHDKKAVVVTIRGTLSLQVKKLGSISLFNICSYSLCACTVVLKNLQIRCNSFLLNEFMLQDILTDFSVEAEKIPLDDGNPNEWFGHKVHVQKYMVWNLNK